MITRTTEAIVNMISGDMLRIYNHIKDLAPQNSKYISIDNGKPVNYIYVNNKRVSTNTGNLHSSVSQVINYGSNKLVHQVFVDGSRVPYYERAVLSPRLSRAKHYGRTEYGNTRYQQSKEETVENRNYLYYMNALPFVKNIIQSYNGKKYYVSDNIGGYE